MKMGFPDGIGVNLFLLKKPNPFVCTPLKLCKAAQAAEVVVAEAVVVVRLGQSQAFGFHLGGGATQACCSSLSRVRCVTHRCAEHLQAVLQ